MLKTFIDRPVLSTVISIVIVVLGLIGLTMLPVEQYPDVAPPTVQVTTVYPGANAEVVLNSVIIPLEEQINGVEGMTYMESSAMNNGMGSIRIYFQQGVNPDIAAVNVQNLAARATPLLPAEVVQQGVTVKKQQNSTILAFTLSTNNDIYDGQFLQNYANINILPQIKRVNGVGEASIFGTKDYSMRIWLKPDAMASYKVAVGEVLAALKDQSIEAAPGEVGANSDQSFQYTLKYTGKYKTEEEFQDIIIRSQDGHILRVKDIADVELGALNYSVITMLNGDREAIFCSISQVAGSNASQVIEDVKAVVKDAQSIMPEGIEINYMMDSSEFLDASIKKVRSTLFEAFLLVFLVVYIFLQDLRSTIIPAIAIPVSILGAFFFMWILGFSINMITLYALILAIGIVVDDAIIVVEAVKAQLEAGVSNAREATLIAIKEIAPAIFSVTLVMASVFIPVSFLPGTTGIFFKQFGLTLAFAIFVSALNALTLSPALCALFLKPETEHEEGDKQKQSFIDRFFYSFNVMFNAATSKYKNTLHFLGKGWRKIIVIAIIAVSGIIILVLNRMIPSDFVPNEDGGSAFALITLPPGASLERSDSVAHEIINLSQDIDAIANVTNISGVNFMAGTGSSYATIIFKLKNWNDRDITTNQLTALLTEKTSHMKNAKVLVAAMPTLQGFGLAAGVTLELQDRMGGNIDEFFATTNKFVDALKARDEIMFAQTNFNTDFPQYEISADIPKIKEAGLTLSDVMMTMQTYIGSYYVSTFNLYGKQFRIMVQSSPEYRKNWEDMNGIFVKTGSGEMAPITEFISYKQVVAPQTLSRFNMYNSMDVMVIPNLYEGYNTGDVYPILEELKGEILGDRYTFDYSGISREGSAGGGQMIIIFGICLIFVYLLLSALYESYIIPLAVLLSLPIGIAGVYIALLFVGLPQGIANNIFVQISMVMLIGLLAKNAILIVEYGVQRREQGMSIVEAAVNGAVARLRPILMTSFAFIAGVFPLVVATGAGAIGNKSLGIATVGGMLIGTMIGIIVIPTLYIVFQALQERISGPKFKTPKTEELIGK